MTALIPLVYTENYLGKFVNGTETRANVSYLSWIDISGQQSMPPPPQFHPVSSSASGEGALYNFSSTLYGSQLETSSSNPFTSGVATDGDSPFKADVSKAIFRSNSTAFRSPKILIPTFLFTGYEFLTNQP